MDYIKVNINIKEEWVEILQALLSEEQFDSFVEHESGFEGYMLRENFGERTKDYLNQLKEDYPFDFQVEDVENKNWNEEWESNFKPVIVKDLCAIRADFHDAISQVKEEIIITPKMSFGTGHHATTYQMVEKIFGLELKGKRVLDMGCGTGVLAILAKKRGAGDTVGIDIDEWSVENSKENIERNGTSDIDIKQGDVEILENYQKFDVILANINRNILLSDMSKYASSLVEGGHILFSGFYTEDNRLMIEEATKCGFVLIDQNERENWSLLHFCKQDNE